MKSARLLRGCSSSILLLLSISFVPTSRAAMLSAKVSVNTVAGSASHLVNKTWQPVQSAAVLSVGDAIRTGKDSTVDLVLPESGTVLRLLPESELSFDRLDELIAGELTVTSTRLSLRSGAVIGSQRKLNAPSDFEIKTPKGVAKVVGTEYIVRADGTVTCMTGEVAFTLDQPADRGSVNLLVGAGSSFDPNVGQVISTSRSQLRDVNPHIQAVKMCADSSHNGHEPCEDHDHDDMSPNHGHGNGNGNGNDHDNGNGNGPPDGHDNGNGNGKGN